jgi:putative hydrolase of the HAD superfamily
VSPRALLFDLDDTLLDYSGAVEQCWAGACALAVDAGVDAASLAQTIGEVRRWFWGDPVRHARERVDMLRAWRTIAERALERVGCPSPALAAALAEDFAARRRAAARLFDDALPCLGALRARGVPLGLVTNGDAAMQRDKIACHGLAGYFDVVVIEGELGVGKPDARVYRHALAALGSASADTTMVGDNLDWDVAGAQQCGLAGVWIDRAARGLPPGSTVQPTRTIRTLAGFEAT